MRVFAVVVLLAALLPLAAPPADAAPVCTPYTSSGSSKSHLCVDPDNSLECVVYSEGWVFGTYYRLCWLQGLA